MSFIEKGASAFGKLIVVAVLAVTFLVGLFGVVYVSLQGEEIKVPDLVGKDFNAGEDELASLGLRIKRRADRLSGEKPNTILEQLPKAGETVKTGQMILVVRSKFDPNAEEEDKPATLKQDDDEDDSEKIEELISDKPKASKKTTNSNKKKTSTTRDVIADKSDNSSDGNSNKTSDSNDSSKGNKNSSTTSGNKSTSADTKKETDAKKETDGKKNTDTKKPAETDKPAKSPGGGETRPRKTPPS